MRAARTARGEQSLEQLIHRKTVVDLEDPRTQLREELARRHGICCLQKVGICRTHIDLNSEVEDSAVWTGDVR